ncbi:leucoanthocyanidin dioxygenase [Penicillium malachiteum]|uniref:leucoanthocyanidin dioxygenase n=1 Tax=Penicillium malachiteum TaxID=1324776 RepID=UPI002548F95D|nr:leucoanthocyanidin dioxygenase [Penicillium malachiteum]KAJ5726009.1 leucoanthocyanidin dioxygenase [Penicillium malachiteum]
MSHVSTLDFSAFCSKDPGRQQSFCQQFTAALQQHGFVKLINHAVPAEGIAKIFEFSKQFFEMDQAAKAVAAHPTTAIPHRGYSFVGQEKTSILAPGEGKPSVDCKESFDMGSPYSRIFPNTWPADCDMPHFRPEIESFYQTCQDFHHTLLRALALGLQLDAHTFDSLVDGNDHELRLLHYPAVPKKELMNGQKTRIAPHTDFGVLTLLFQDDVGGLQVMDQQTGLYSVVDGSHPIMLVNVGDSLQRWTNNHLRAVLHQVTAPSQSPSGTDSPIFTKERFSVAFFGKPNRACSLHPLPQLLLDGECSQYPDITAGEYQDSRIHGTY